MRHRMSSRQFCRICTYVYTHTHTHTQIFVYMQCFLTSYTPQDVVEAVLQDINIRIHIYTRTHVYIYMYMQCYLTPYTPQDVVEAVLQAHGQHAPYSESQRSRGSSALSYGGTKIDSKLNVPGGGGGGGLGGDQMQTDEVRDVGGGMVS